MEWLDDYQVLYIADSSATTINIIRQRVGEPVGLKRYLPSSKPGPNALTLQAIEYSNTSSSSLSYVSATLGSSSLRVRSSSTVTLIFLSVSSFKFKKVGITRSGLERLSRGCCHWTSAARTSFSVRKLREPSGTWAIRGLSRLRKGR